MVQSQVSEDDKLISAILTQGQNEFVDKMIAYLQSFLEKKIPFVPYARLGSEDGMKLSRSAFAVIAKFSSDSIDSIS